MSVTFAPHQARRLVPSILALFFLNGLLMGAWVGALPGLRHRLHTDAAGVGWLLIVAGVGAIVSMQIAGHFGDRTNARTPAFFGACTIIAGEVVVSFASTFSLVALGAVLIGSGNGSMGVSMNALGVNAETVAKRRVMSRLHAMASLGGFSGAFVIFIVARRASSQHGDPREALWCAAGLSAAASAGLMVWAPKPRTPLHPSDDAPAAKGKVPPQAWLLGMMALLFGFTEGAAVDWSSILVTEVAHVSPAVGAAGLICVTLSMVSVRYIGDRLVQKWGPKRTLRCASPLAAFGFAITGSSTTLGLILGGWLLVGFGVALIAPQIYGLAGRLGAGRTLAIVSGFGYAAFLTGPGLIGWLASKVGIQHAMVIPFVTSFLLAGMTYLPAIGKLTDSGRRP